MTAGVGVEPGGVDDAARDGLRRAARGTMSSPADVPAGLPEGEARWTHRSARGRSRSHGGRHPRPTKLPPTRSRPPGGSHPSVSAHRVFRAGPPRTKHSVQRHSDGYAVASARAELGVRQGAPGCRLEAAVLERADPGAHEAGHGVADGLAHPPDLAVAALVDRDPQHARARAATPSPAAVGPSSSSTPSRSRRIAPGAHRACRRPSPGTPCRPVARVGDAVGQLAVVRQQQQALGVDVEPPDREDPRLGRHELARPSDARACPWPSSRRRAACSAGSGRGPA